MTSFKKTALVLLPSFLLLTNISLKAQTLHDAVMQTITTNPGVAIQAKSWLAARQGTKAARGGYFPSVDLGADFGREKVKNNSTNFDYKTQTRSGIGISLRQMLFDGFATKSEVARNRYLTLAEKYALLSKADDAALDTTKVYLDVLRTKDLLALAKRNYNTHLRIYNMIKKRALKGLSRKADIAQSYGRLASARANLFAAQANYTDAQTMFLQVVGFKPDNLVMPKAPTTALFPNDEVTAIQMALANHPELKAAEADINEAQAQYKAAMAPYFPKVDGVLSASHDRNIGGIKGSYNNYAALLELKYNLFRGGADIAKDRQAAFLVEEAKAIRDRTYRQTVENMKLSWSALKTSQKQLTSFKKHQDAAKKTVNAYGEQFKLAKRTLLDVLNAETELFNASSDYINGKYKILYTQYRVLNSAGNLLPYMQIVLFHKYHRPSAVVNKSQIKTTNTKAVTLQPKAYVTNAKKSAAAVTTNYTVTDKHLAANAVKNYTIQLYTSYNKDDAIKFITANNLQQKAAFYKTNIGGRDKYVVILGAYATPPQAMKMIKSLPQNVKVNPVIRSLADVQNEMQS